jgi:ABC-2 type transport system ATP-binding protein
MKALEREPQIQEVAAFGGGLHVSVEDPASATSKIRESLSRRGIEVHRLEVIPPSMEDVFVAMIEEEERKAL